MQVCLPNLVPALNISQLFFLIDNLFKSVALFFFYIEVYTIKCTSLTVELDEVWHVYAFKYAECQVPTSSALPVGGEWPLPPASTPPCSSRPEGQRAAYPAPPHPLHSRKCFGLQTRETYVVIRITLNPLLSI